MEKKLNVFQIVIIIIFIVVIIVAVVVFSQSGKSGGGGATGGTVTVWGPFSSTAVLNPIGALASEMKDTSGVAIQYSEKNPATYEADLVNAFASGTGPDIFVLTPDMIIKHQNKILEIPFTSFPLRSYQSAYIDGSQIFTTDTGVLGFPFAIDPLILYYNKDMLNNAGHIIPPKTWEELTQMVPSLVTFDQSHQIAKSAVAFGQFGNIDNASEIFQTLLLQLGDPIVSFDKGLYEAKFGFQTPISSTPAQTAIGFYTQFSNPVAPLYSWNALLPRSRDMFIQGRLAFYIGFASELQEIQRQNINLNFDITMIPQREGTNRNVTYAHMYAFALSKQTKNAQSAFSVASSLGNGSQTSVLAQNIGLAPVRRDLLSTKNPNDVYSDILHKSALISYSWFNPNTKVMYQYFKDTIDPVIRGASTAGRSASDTRLKMQSFIDSLR